MFSIYLSSILLFSSVMLVYSIVFSSILNSIVNSTVSSSGAVPDDVFAPNYVWKGSYNYRSRKLPMTLAITSFNSTTGRVNVTLSNGNLELLLSGAAQTHPPPPVFSACIYARLRQVMNMNITRC